MRVNLYEEEFTGKVDLVKKTVDGKEFVGIRFHAQLPLAPNGEIVQGGKMFHPGDGLFSGVTLWGREKLLAALFTASDLIGSHLVQTAQGVDAVSSSGLDSTLIDNR